MTIEKAIHSLFNLKTEEGPKFMLLFTHSFFLGIYIAVSFVPANSVFIHHYGSDMLPLAYIMSGLAGYLTTFVYSILQKRVKSRTLFVSALAFTAFITIFSRVGLFFIDEKLLSFFVFMWAGPLGALVTIESGGMAMEMLNLRQVKRLFGPISIGGIFSSVLGYLIIPIIVPFLSHAYDLMLIAAAGTIAGIVMVFVIYKKIPDKLTEDNLDDDEEELDSTDYKNLIRHKYFILMFVSAAFSMLTIYFTDFGYLSSIKAQKDFFNTAEELSSFIAIIAFIFKVGELLLSYFSTRILSSGGLKYGLVALPFASTFFVFLALISSIFFGASSLTFFAMMVLNKISERVLRRGLEDPSFNILYQPLPDSQKLAVQAKVGVAQQVATGLSGILLLLISKLLLTDEGFKLEYYTYFFIPFLIGWSFIARKLYNAYRDKLRQILAEKNRKKQSGTSHLYGRDILLTKLNSTDTEQLKMCVTILSETSPASLFEKHNLLLSTNSATIKKAVLRNVEPTYPIEIKVAIQQIALYDETPAIKQLAEIALKNLDFSTVTALRSEDILTLINSNDVHSKMQLIKYLIKNDTSEDESIIKVLLKDNDKNVRKAAIQLAGQKNIFSLKLILIELLRFHETYHLASEALLNSGEKVILSLDKEFDKDNSPDVLMKIAEIFGKIGTDISKKYLLSHLDFPDQKVQSAVIHALYYSEFQADEQQEVIIKKKIRDIISNIIWLYACINDVVSEKNTLKLIQALDLDREARFDELFKLLSFIYQPTTIDLIKKNIIGENTIFALEIVENFINQDLKQLLIPLFDDISLSQKIKKLHGQFPQEKFKFSDRLKDIIIKDYYMADVWTKAKAIELLGKLHKRKKTDETKGGESNETTEDLIIWTESNVLKMLSTIRKSEMPDEVFVCLYHTEELIYSTAAKIIFDENPMRCFDYLQKLTPEKQELYEVLEAKKANSQILLIEKVKVLKRLPLFFSVPENILVKLCEILKVKTLKKGEELNLINDYPNDIFIISKGELFYEGAENNSVTFGKNDIIVKGLNVNQHAEKVSAKKETFILYGNRAKYFNVLLDETEIIQHIFEQIEERK